MNFMNELLSFIMSPNKFCKQSLNKSSLHVSSMTTSPVPLFNSVITTLSNKLDSFKASLSLSTCLNFRYSKVTLSKTSLNCFLISKELSNSFIQLGTFKSSFVMSNSSKAFFRMLSISSSLNSKALIATTLTSYLTINCSFKLIASCELGFAVFNTITNGLSSSFSSSTSYSSTSSYSFLENSPNHPSLVNNIPI